MRKFWPALALLPLLLGLAALLPLQGRRLPNPIIYLRVDLGTLAFLLGLAGSAAATAGLLAWQRHRQQLAAAAVCAHREEHELRRQFIRRLDHEVKNPLTALRAALANLAATGDGAVLASLRGQVDRLARLTTDLRKLTEMETQPMEHEPVDLGQLLAELVLLARQKEGPAARELHLSLPQAPWPLPALDGDRDLLYLACYNLLDNALKFAGPEAKIEVRAYEDGQSLVAEVADTGPGVSHEDLPHLGEQLYRGRAALAVEGSGLGLALVRAIAERHGGTMSVRSREGRGTVVALRFPVPR